MRGTRKRGLGLLAAAVLAIGIVGAACDPSPPPERNCPEQNQASTVSIAIMNRVNWDRGMAHLNTLNWNSVLACNARDWADTMARTNQFVHQDLNSVIHDPLYVNYASLGENILVGPNSMDANTMYNAWWNSAGHRANILGWYDVIGVAVLRTLDGRTWAVQEFGRHF
jgi:uncharacterized protein YkwD